MRVTRGSTYQLVELLVPEPQAFVGRQDLGQAPLSRPRTWSGTSAT